MSALQLISVSLCIMLPNDALLSVLVVQQEGLIGILHELVEAQHGLPNIRGHHRQKRHMPGGKKR